MNYTPLHIYSHYSILKGLNSPKEIAKYCKDLDMKACALTDINNMSGCIEFYQACKDYEIKPIIGIVINTTEGTLLLIAKNQTGYVNLLNINAKLNSKKYYPIINLDNILKYTKDIICIIGHENSSLYNCIVQKFNIREDYSESVKNYLTKLKTIFSDIYIEFQFSEYDTLSIKIKEILLELANQYNLSTLICPRVYYLNKEDKALHQILVSVDTGDTLEQLNKINHPMYKFCDGYKFHLPTYQELIQENQVQSYNEDKSYSIIHTDPIYETALTNTNKIASTIEDYNIKGTPSVPKFKSDSNKTSEEIFKEYIELGWKNKIQNIIPKSQHEIYRKRIDSEIEVFKEVGLFDYFLIIKDIIDYAKSKDYLVGVGRGSIGGCLTGYLLGIHSLDSIKYNLIFERFFNTGRANSFPDIDTDFEKRSRNDIINYIITKYNKQNVMHIATYGTLMGRAALKAVFRAYGDVSFAEQNEITKNIVDKAKISDELQLIKDAGEDPSVIKWCLNNHSKSLSQWCTISEDGQLSGPLASRFEQAINLEGVISTLSIHAAGICIATHPLKNLVPIVFNTKDKTQSIGCQMNDLEYAGLLKVDILGVSSLDRLKDINDI